MTKSKIKLPVLLFAALSMGLFLVLSFYGFIARKQAVAAANNTINFQARLMTTAGAIVPDGNYNVEFKIYNSASSSGSSQGSCTGDSACLWAETRTSSNVVRVANGYLTVNLGSVTSFPNTINWDQNLWITMNIGGKNVSPSWDGEMSPRLKLTGVPYAFRAGQLAANNGSFTSTLGFVQPMASNSILLPDASGTVCLQNSSACGFALASGSGNYIQNGTSLQSGANFNIGGTGIAATALQAPLFDTATATALNIGTTNATSISLSKSTTITGGISQSGGTVSLAGNAASSITSSSSLTLTANVSSNWTVGGTNQSLTITTSGSGVLTLGTTGAGTVTLGSSSQNINIGTTNNAHTVHIADGGTSTTQAVTIGSTNGSSNTAIQGGTGATAIALTTGTNGKISLTSQGSGGVTGLLGSTGFTLKTTTDSSTAFAIQASNNDYIFSVNTSTGTVTLGAIQATYSGFDGTLNTPLGNLTLGATNGATRLLGNSAMTLQATSGSFTTTVGFATPTANRTVTIPDASGTICLQNSTSCGFAPSSGSTGYIQNSTTTQSANLNVQAATSGSVAGVFQANAAGSGDILDLRNGAGTNVVTVGSTGATLFQNSTNSANAFQVQSQSGGQLLNIDTQSTVTSINGGSSQLGPWRTATSTPQALRYSGSASANGFVYTIGGYDGAAYRNSVFFSQQNTDGSLGVWSSGTNLPVALAATGVVIANNYIYVLGGQSGSGVVSTVYYATINPTTGAVGSWTTAANPLPTALGWGSATVANGYVYYAGGHNGTTNVSTVYYSQLNAGTGAVGSWTSSGNTLPATRDSGALVVNNNYLYFVGGVTSTNAPVNNVYYAPINAGTGAVSSAWTSGQSLPGARAYPGVVAANGYLYVAGGQDSSNIAQSTAYYAKPASNGAIASWNAGAGLPSPVSGAAVSIAANGYVYSVGGWSAFYTSAAYYASTQNILSIGSDIVANGALSLQASNNSTNAFQVQNASGYQLVNVNASDNTISINANAATNGANSQWSLTSSLPVQYDGASSVTVNGFIYYIGGYDGTNYNTDVYYAKSSGNGTVGSWKTGASLPAARAFSSAVAANGYIYLIGGNNAGTFASTNYYAKVNADGSLSSWQATTALPAARAYGSAVTANGYIYFLGGRGTGNTYNTTVYYAAINAADGTVGSWTTSGNTLPAARNLHASVTANGYIYVLGGASDATTTTTTTYYASINAGTGAVGVWGTTTALPAAIDDHMAVTTGGYVYVLGGYNGSNVQDSVYYAQMNADGTVGSWTTSPKSLSQPVNFGAATVANGYVYVLGGYTGTGFLGTVYSTAMQGAISLGGNTSVTGTASFQGSNSQSAFQIQNASGDQLLNVDSVNNVITLNGGVGGALTSWKQTSNLNTSASFAGSTIANGYAYMFGGYGSGYSTTVQYAPIKASGEMGTWTTTTALPEARGYTAAVSTTGYMYVVGGTTGAANRNTIYIAKQNSDGTLGGWQTSPVTLPATLNAMSVTVVNGYLYVIGGTTGSAVSTVYYAHINGDGSINSFITGTALPTALANASVVTANGYLYFLGGYTGSTAVSTVYYSALDPNSGSNGAWGTTTTLPAATSNFGAAVLNGNVYFFRANGTAYYAALNADGTIGKWVTDSNTMPVAYNGVSAMTSNGYIYLLGGYTGSVGTSGVYYTSGARTMIAGTLDLVGMTAEGNLTGDTSQSTGSVGGALIAGNTTVVGTLQVQGQAAFNQNVSINANSLTVGNDMDSTSTGNTLITVQSRGFAGLELYGDSSNDNTAEGGGAYVLYSTDGILGTEAITGLVQKADIDPSGTDYTGAVANNMLLGTRSNFGIQFGTNSTVRMVLTNGGNLCIGLTSCTHKLAVNGQIYSTSSTITTGTPDLSETISAADDVEAMDVVVADPDTPERVVKSSQAYDSSVVGVVSDGTSGFLIDHLHYGKDNDPNDTTHRVPLTLAGRVYVKVTDESGSIKPGDYLASSSKPGYAMKATQAGSTIGKALGYFDGSAGKVLVLVDPGYHDPSGGLQGTSNNFASLNVSGDANIHRLTVGAVDVSGDVAIAGSLRVSGQTNLVDIVIAGHIITKGSAPVIAVQPAAGQNAQVTLSGNDSVGLITVTAGSDGIADILAKITFAKQYEVPPGVVISPVGRASAQLGPYVDQISPHGFSIGTLVPMQNGVTYNFSYQTVQ